MFLVEQAKLKLKMKNEPLHEDQKEAVVFTKQMLEKTEPHVKKDILKFNKKIEDLEKEIKSQEKIMFAWKFEYEDVKEQFQQHRDSKKGSFAQFGRLSNSWIFIALEAIASSMRIEIEGKKKHKKGKFKRLFGKKKKDKGGMNKTKSKESLDNVKPEALEKQHSLKVNVDTPQDPIDQTSKPLPIHKSSWWDWWDNDERKQEIEEIQARIFIWEIKQET